MWLDADIVAGTIVCSWQRAERQRSAEATEVSATGRPSEVCGERRRTPQT